MELDFPRGFKFAPTDYEIIVYYLVPKIQKDAIQDDTIVEQNVYATDPGFLNCMTILSLISFLFF